VLVSVLIPNREQLGLLRRCLSSLMNVTQYPDLEVLVIENNSRDPALWEYYRQLEASGVARVIVLEQPTFNYSALNNVAAAAAQGEVLVLLNNDTEIIQADWIDRMLEHVLRPEVGVVGAKLLFADQRIQHGGVIHLPGLVDHLHRGEPACAAGYAGRLQLIGNQAAVTGACLMVRASVYQELGGLDERLAVAFNDVDLCFRARERGYSVVYTPHAALVHFESRSRGRDETIVQRERTAREFALLRSRWGEQLEHDPFTPFAMPAAWLFCCS
jgi:GT2 family glycosyltransferase